MRWCTRSTRTAEPAPMPTLEGFALDDECCFFGCDESLLDSFIDLGNQRRIFATGTTRVTTKGAFCGMNDGVFHQDEKGLLVLFLHRVCSLGHLLSRCDPPENTV